MRETDLLPAEDPLPVFVSVKDAIPLLGVSERTIRRFLPQLPLSAVAPKTRGAQRYRLSELRKLIGAEEASLTEPATAKNGVLENATAEPKSAPVLAAEPPRIATADNGAVIAELRAQVAELKQDKAQLWQALEREQETARGALVELTEVRREYALLQAATRARRIAPAMVPDGAVIVSDAPESGDTGHSPLSTPPRAPEREPDAAQAERSSSPTSAGAGQVPAAAPTGEAVGTGPDADYSAQNNSDRSRPSGSVNRRWWEFWRKKDEG